MAVSDKYRWDRRAQRFRHRSNGQFVARQTTLRIAERARNAAIADLQALGRQLNEGRISTHDFHQQASLTIRQIHVQQAVLGAGGSDRVSSETWLAIGRNVKKNIATGVDEDGRRYGLRELLKEVQDGSVSDRQLLARLQLYANSGKESYWQANINHAIAQGETWGERVLNEEAENCECCPVYAAMGPVPLDQIVLPTQKCPCGPNCRCRIVTMTLEEAVLRGAVQSSGWV
ncbi:MAG: hypothetical protein AAFY26_06150 [Cyanobacteria bacterium J06638_22]